MRRIAFLSICLLLPLRSPSAQIQTLDQELKDFRAQVLGNRLLVRGYSDDLVTTFQWSGAGFSPNEPKLHALAAIKADHIELQANKLKISGERAILVRDKDGSLRLDGGDPAVIVVDLRGADVPNVISSLKSVLFFPTIREALAALPAGYSSILPAKPIQNASTDSSPVPKYAYCPVEGQKFQRATILDAPDAEFSEEAKQARFSGAVRVAVSIGEDGRTRDIWILRPAGLGLDQKAGQAASRYKFHPATCDGNPVESTMYVDVDFTVLPR